MQRVRTWITIATNRVVLRRSLVTCVVVGVVLTAINHGDALSRGDIGPTRALQVALTFLVPFLVATISTTAAIRSRIDGLDSHVSARERQPSAHGTPETESFDVVGSQSTKAKQRP